MQAYKTSQGNWQLNFSEGGIQKTLYLGRRFTASSADRVARIITEILDHRNRGDSFPIDLRRKIESLPLRIRQGIERFGLVSDFGDHTLSELLHSFYETKKHFKKRTLEKYKYYGNHLIEYFEKDRRLSSIQCIDCERFRSYCLERLSDCTVSRGIRGCRSIFRHAVDLEWLLKNPFDKVRGGVEVNLDRQNYIDRQIVHRVMDCCDNDLDRLILALARFGGLRIPSEIQNLRFSDFTDNVIKIHKDTKTGAREVPLFHEIKEVFDRLLTARMVDPADFIFVGSRRYRNRILTAIHRSGSEVWEKLFTNLRSSCITDLAERGYSEKTLDAIFGNSAPIRSLHYVQFRKEREYLRVLQDDYSLFKSESVIAVPAITTASTATSVPDDLKNNDLLLRLIGSSGDDLDEILVLRDLLVSHFGTVKKAS